jgi:ubiquinone/menaquinone biosynthesis C-methylase UbiE
MKLVGLTRVKNEKEMLIEHLDHLALFCDEIWAYDDYSTDGTYGLLKNHPAVKKVLRTSKDWQPKPVGSVPDALELAKKTQRLLDEASKNSDADWFIYLDVDERLDEDLLKALPRLMKQKKYDAICFELYDFFMTEKDKNRIYQGDIQTIRPYCGTEYREQLFLWRNLCGLYYQEGAHREPTGFNGKRILYSTYKIKHYGKAKSINDYLKKSQFYHKFRPQLRNSRFKFTLPAVRKTESDLGKLVTWEMIKKNSKIKGPLFYKYSPPEKPLKRFQYQLALAKKRFARKIKNWLLGPNILPDKLKSEFSLKKGEGVIDQPDSMKKAYQTASAVENYEQTRFSKPDRAVSHDKEVRIVNQILSKERPKKILDLALGPARVSQYLNQQYFEQGFGLDSSPAMLKKAKKRLDSKKWQLVCGDAFKLPFKANELDTVMTFRFIRHFKKNDRQQLLREIRRVLKPDGILIFEAFNKDMGQYALEATGIGKPSAFAEPVYDELWSQISLKKELKNVGFVIEKLYPVLNHFKNQHRLSKLASILARRFQINLIIYLAKIIIRVWDWFPSKNNHQWEVVCRKIAIRH